MDWAAASEIGAWAGAVIPFIGVIWNLSAQRGSRMAKELQLLEQAIESAARRKDPLEYAYRTVLHERLNRVHQRNRTSSAGAQMVLWGSYAALFWTLAFYTRTRTSTTTNLGTAVAVAATLSSFLALRGWSRWRMGNMTLEREANDAYQRAMTENRRKFVEYADTLGKLETPPEAGKTFKNAINQTLDLVGLRGDARWLAALAGVVCILLAWAGQVLLDRQLTYLPIVAALLAGGLVVMPFRILLARLQELRAWMNRKWPSTVSALLCWASVLVSGLALLVALPILLVTWFMDAFLGEWRRTGDNQLWGWCLVLALVFILEMVAISIQRPERKA